jgi:hypothetical protein
MTTNLNYYILFMGKNTLTNDQRQIVFECVLSLLGTGLEVKQVEQITNTEIEIDDDETVISITYPDGIGLSHWI